MAFDYQISSKFDILNMYASLDIGENYNTFNSIGKTSFVLINPHFDFQLEQNDIIYILRPGNLKID